MGSSEEGEGEPPFTCRGRGSRAAFPSEEIVVLGEKGSAWADPPAGVDGTADYDGFVFDGWLFGCDKGCEGVDAGDGVRFGVGGRGWRRWW